MRCRMGFPRADLGVLGLWLLAGRKRWRETGRLWVSDCWGLGLGAWGFSVGPSGAMLQGRLVGVPESGSPCSSIPTPPSVWSSGCSPRARLGPGRCWTRRMDSSTALSPLLSEWCSRPQGRVVESLGDKPPRHVTAHVTAAGGARVCICSDTSPSPQTLCSSCKTRKISHR